MLEIKLLNVDKYYDDKNKLNITALRIKILEISPSIVLISICFSESLDLRFALEREGIYPHLRLKGDLRLTTNGKQIQLDEVQVKLLDTMADEKNVEKTTVLHGPEGSGKTLLALEVAKMKLSHYLKKEKLKGADGKNSLQLIICGSYVGEDRVPFLLKQLKEEIKDMQDFCSIEFKPVANLPMSTPKKFAKSIEKLLDLGNQKVHHTIVLMDELFPGFETSQWSEFKGIEKVDFVLALRHAFNDGLCLGWRQMFKRKETEF